MVVPTLQRMQGYCGSSASGTGRDSVENEGTGETSVPTSALYAGCQQNAAPGGATTPATSSALLSAAGMADAMGRLASGDCEGEATARLVSSSLCS